jgi:hypothetical protein
MRQDGFVCMRKIDSSWTSLRDRFPFQRDVYKVYDCTEDIEGIAIYDGVNFEKPKWNKPNKGHLMLIDYRITHWKFEDL